MIASRIGRAGVGLGPFRFGGSSSARIGSTSAHSSSGSRQIGGSGARSFLGRPISRLPHPRDTHPPCLREMVSKSRSAIVAAPAQGQAAANRLGRLPLYHRRPTESAVAVPTGGTSDLL